MPINESAVTLSYWPPAYAANEKSRHIRYKIKYRKEGELGDGWQRTTDNSTSQNVTNLKTNSTYEFRVAATYSGETADNYGPDSDAIWFRTAGKLYA